MAFSKKIREEVYKKTDGHCAYCGCPLSKRWHVDHVIPINRGYDKREDRCSYMDLATESIDNYLPACPSCNINKSNLSVEDFRQSILKYYESQLKSNLPFKVMNHYGVIRSNLERFFFYFEKQGIVVKNQYEYEIAHAEYYLDYYKNKLAEENKEGNLNNFSGITITLINLYQKQFEYYYEIVNYYKKKLKESK